MIESCIYFMYRIYVSRAIKGIRRENAITAFEPSIPPCPTLHAALHGIWHGCWVQNLKATCTNTMKPKTSRHGTRWVDHGCWPLMDVNTIDFCHNLYGSNSGLPVVSALASPPVPATRNGSQVRCGWQGMLLFCGVLKFFFATPKINPHDSIWFLDSGACVICFWHW